MTRNHTIQLTLFAFLLSGFAGIAHAKTPGMTTKPGESPLAFQSGDYKVTPVLDIYAELRHQMFSNEQSDDLHEFRLSRAHLGFRALGTSARAAVILEAEHSAGGGAQMGLAGDSIIARFREASAGLHWNPWLIMEAGLIRSALVDALLSGWKLRPLAPVALEQEGLYAPADLGARAIGYLPQDFGEVSFSITNGEGYDSRELNNGKNLETVVRIRPLASIDGGKPLEFILGYVNGSKGSAGVLTNRLVAGAQWDTPRLGIGANWALVQGIQLNGEQEGHLLTSYIRGEPVEQWIVATRLLQFQRNTADKDDSILRAQCATGWRFASPVTLLVSGERSLPGETTKEAQPDTDKWVIRTILSARF